MGTRLGRVDFQSPRIQFELDKPERLSFVGDVRAGVMAGQITAKRRTTPFHFTRIAKTLLGRRSRFAGKLRRDDERSADILRLRLRIFRDAAEVGYQTRFAYAEMTPLCIHRAPLGTHDRFIGFIIEHDAGNLPLLKGS